jgi:hypothetical protein
MNALLPLDVWILARTQVGRRKADMFLRCYAEASDYEVMRSLCGKSAQDRIADVKWRATADWSAA